MILYFKKYKDTNNGTNWAYDSNCLAVDNNFADLTIEIPKRKINEFNVYGQGAVVIPTYFYDNRKISFTYRFKQNNNTIFTNEKDNILLNWFYSNDEIYLVRNTEKGLQKIKGIFQLSTKEKYKSYAISNDISIDFITEDAFFESVNETVITKTMSTNSVDIDFTNNGFFTGWVIEYTNANAFTDIEIIYNNYSFRMLQLNENQIKNYVIDMRYFRFTKGGFSFVPIFTGQSFYLENGNGVMQFKCVGRGTVKLKFKERYI